jgi:hypothetical protein
MRKSMNKPTAKMKTVALQPGTSSPKVSPENIFTPEFISYFLCD